MSKLVVERFCHAEFGTYSKLKYMGFECFGVERPWLDNKTGESCIPVGEYPIKLGRYNKGGYACWEVLDVPGRTQIKIHKANVPSELNGCIAPGMSTGFYKGQWSVGSSGTAFNKLMAMPVPNSIVIFNKVVA